MSELYQRTRELLLQRPRTLTYHEIARRAELPFEFVRNVARDTHKAPNVHNVEKLYELLSGRKLRL